MWFTLNVYVQYVLKSKLYVCTLVFYVPVKAANQFLWSCAESLQNKDVFVYIKRGTKFHHIMQLNI